MNQSTNLLETVFWFLWKNKYQAQFRMNWYYLDGEQIAFMLNEHWAQSNEGKVASNYHDNCVFIVFAFR